VNKNLLNTFELSGRARAFLFTFLAIALLTVSCSPVTATPTATLEKIPTPTALSTPIPTSTENFFDKSIEVDCAPVASTKDGGSATQAIKDAMKKSLSRTTYEEALRLGWRVYSRRGASTILWAWNSVAEAITDSEHISWEGDIYCLGPDGHVVEMEVNPPPFGTPDMPTK
jgi:hypothetical protein